MSRDDTTEFGAGQLDQEATEPVPQAFVGRVMGSLDGLSDPSPLRSFLDAARLRAFGEATDAVVVASHLAIRGRRVPLAVRLQALVFVVAIACVAGTGLTLAASAAVRVAGPIVGLPTERPIAVEDLAGPAPSPEPATVPADPGARPPITGDRSSVTAVRRQERAPTGTLDRDDVADEDADHDGHHPRPDGRDGPDGHGGRTDRGDRSAGVDDRSDERRDGSDERATDGRRDGPGDGQRGRDRAGGDDRRGTRTDRDRTGRD